MIPEIHIKDYYYDLPEDRIAKYPLERRDASKLIVYKDGTVSESVFRELPSYISEGSLMVFNDTKVVPARLHFHRASGAEIEVFCLEPVSPAEYNLAFASNRTCSWKCVIGNAKRWKDDVIQNDSIGSGLSAKLLQRDGRTGIVEFSWNSGDSFSQILEQCGQVPIPPYLNRETEQIDKERYQTLYAKIKGSVAAPTAGLHFTEEVLKAIRDNGVDIQNVCLHVGAGTFLPVKTDNVAEHPMHREPFSVSLSLLRKLRDSAGKTVAVGTTSVRTLESLYYVGVSCIEKGHPEDVGQWDPYTRDYPYSTGDALDAIIHFLEKEGLESLTAGTRIIIVPGFTFRIVNRMVTNFHQPESTLILLISAFVGGDWRTIYNFALSHGVRFLSYGDSSLLFRKTL